MGGTPPDGIDQWDGKEGERGNTSTPRDEPGKLIGGSPPINQITRVQGTSPSDRYDRDQQQGYIHPFRPLYHAAIP